MQTFYKAVKILVVRILVLIARWVMDYIVQVMVCWLQYFCVIFCFTILIICFLSFIFNLVLHQFLHHVHDKGKKKLLKFHPNIMIYLAWGIKSEFQYITVIPVIILISHCFLCCWIKNILDSKKRKCSGFILNCGEKKDIVL